MTDRSRLTPEHDAVRRLLADARHDEPMPTEVVARLDETIAALAAERSAPTTDPAPAPVVDLGARRRRLAQVGVLAAAAVVVAGVALGQVVSPSGDDASSGDSSTASSDGGDSFAEEPQPELQSEEGTGGDSGGAQELAPQARPDAYPTLSSTDAALEDDLVDLRASLAAPASALDSGRTLKYCDLSGSGRGRRVAAEIDGQVGVVIFRRPDGAAQDVDLYVCGVREPVATTVLPAP